MIKILFFLLFSFQAFASEDLLFAVGGSNLQEVKAVLKNPKVDINFKNEKDVFALYLAVDRQNLDVLNYFLTFNPELEQTYYYEGRETSLHLAAHLNNLAMVKALVKQGAKVDALTEVERLPVQRCREGQFYEGTPFHLAVFGQNLEMVDYLIKHGADVNRLAHRFIWSGSVYTKKFSALAVAVFRKDLKMMKLLIDNGIFVDEINGSYELARYNRDNVEVASEFTALHMVLFSSDGSAIYREMFKLLIKSGASFNIKAGTYFHEGNDLQNVSVKELLLKDDPYSYLELIQ